MMTAIILAGGLGTRLRDAVPDLPKPMAPINGRPFLEHQLDYWIGQGVQSFVLSVGYKHEEIMRHFGSSYRGASLDYAIESTPLGTGGGLLLAASRLPLTEPLLVLNGDTFFEVPLVRLLSYHKEHLSDWTFALFRAEESGRYMGMQVADDGAIKALRADDQNRDGVLANGGVYIVSPSAFDRCDVQVGHKASLENDLLATLLRKGSRLFGLECPGRFIDIGIPYDYHRAAEFLCEC